MKDVDEHEIEQSLRRLRPVGPPPGFREAVIGPRRASAMPWAAVAAALFAAVVLLRAGMAQQIEEFTPDEPTSEARGMMMLTEALGGDAEARRMAEILVQQNAIRQANAVTAREGAQ